MLQTKMFENPLLTSLKQKLFSVNNFDNLYFFHLIIFFFFIFKSGAKEDLGSFLPTWKGNYWKQVGNHVGNCQLPTWIKRRLVLLHNLHSLYAFDDWFTFPFKHIQLEFQLLRFDFSDKKLTWKWKNTL